jgi:hypothetical protein
VGFENEDCSVAAAACSIYLPDPCFDSLHSLFDYLPEPIKERSLLSRETQRRQPPLPMRLPPDSKIYAAEVYPNPTCDVMRQLSKSLKLFPYP